MTGESTSSRGTSRSHMRVLGSYALVYLTGGTGEYQLAGESPRPCRAGDLLVVFPEIAHRYGPPKGAFWREMYIVFAGALFDLWRAHGILSVNHPVLHPGNSPKLRSLFRKVVGSYPCTRTSRQLEMVAELQQFLTSVLAREPDGMNAGQDTPWPPWLERCVRNWEENPLLSVNKLIAESGRSYESFRKSFKKLTGESPGRFRDRLLFSLARKLIFEERLSNKELADRLGFCNEFHFSKRFRLMTGEWPSQFRNRLFQTRTPFPTRHPG